MQAFFLPALADAQQKPYLQLADEKIVHSSEAVCLYLEGRQVPGWTQCRATLSNHFIYLVSGCEGAAACISLSCVHSPCLQKGSLIASDKICFCCWAAECSCKLHLPSLTEQWNCAVCASSNCNRGITCDYCGNKKTFWQCKHCYQANQKEAMPQVCSGCQRARRQPPNVVEAKLSFRNGGAAGFLANLRQICLLAAWKSESKRPALVAGRLPLGAIAQQMQAATAQTSTIDSLAAMAAKMNEITLLANSLSVAAPSSFCISSPVLKRNCPTAASYEKELAAEFLSFIPTFMRAKGINIITVIDSFREWNNARAFEYVSTSLLASILGNYLCLPSSPLAYRRLSSGIAILHGPEMDTEKLFQQILDASGPFLCSYSLRLPGVPQAFVKDLLADMEQVGLLARDDCMQGRRFYKNII